MRRREFITLLGASAAAWPVAAHAQQRLPVVGYLDTASASTTAHLGRRSAKALAPPATTKVGMWRLNTGGRTEITTSCRAWRQNLFDATWL